MQIQVRDKHSSVKALDLNKVKAKVRGYKVKYVTIRASSVSNSNFFYKTEGLRVKDEG